MRESHWRLTGEWLDPIETLEVLIRSDGLRVTVTESISKAETPYLPWRQIVSD